MCTSWQTARMRGYVKAVLLVGCVFLGCSCTSPEYMKCACTSTHFVDVRFTVECWRNVTEDWKKLSESSDNTFSEASKVTCTRGSRPPAPAPDYRLVEEVGYYKFHPRQATWEDALGTCASEGANLAVLNSAAEASAMENIFNEFPFLSAKDWVNDQAWIGANDLKTEGTFLSLRGIPLREEGWEHWASGEPNNEGDGEDCVVFNRDKEFTDEPCDEKFPFFCEIPLL